MAYSVLKINGLTALSQLVEIMVDDENSLPTKAACQESHYSLGSIAFTPDSSKIWRLDREMNWVLVVTNTPSTSGDMARYS